MATTGSHDCIRPASLPENLELSSARNRMGRHFTPQQVLGRTRSIGCVALEVTQRCDLDCTLCYLSQHSQRVRDLPIEELLWRLELIRRRYGPGTNVQITGGEPTLREPAELERIVRTARKLGLLPALFTNGIRASRALLARLAAAGLADVAFHVDTTQRRKGFADERALHAVRLEYLDRARNLGLMVTFNTTVHSGNLHEVPDLVRFFVAQAGGVGFASFQLQAETGRGEWKNRDTAVTLPRVRELVDAGAGSPLPWDVVRMGHPSCHSYAPVFVAGGRAWPVIEDARLLADYLEDFADLQTDRSAPRRHTLVSHLWHARRKPAWYGRSLWFVLQHLGRRWREVLRGRGRVHKLSFFVHDFMDARSLDAERVEACSFMVMTPDGPVSMCAHNARRDDYILRPLEIHRADGQRETFIPLRDVTPAIHSLVAAAR